MDSDSSTTFPDQQLNAATEELPLKDADSDEEESDLDDNTSVASDDPDLVVGDASDIEDSDSEKSDLGSDVEVDSANPAAPPSLDFDESDLESDDGLEDEEYLQKFDRAVRKKFLEEYHPQAQTHNYEEVAAMAKVTRAADGRIIDALHRTIPILTKYERTRILGQRAAQLNSGAQPLVPVPTGVLQGHVIAGLELKAKKLPFIIRRPLPNRGSEYWHVSDLELL
jgi:DNA-directed RNA polymerase I, II, and III subunit RPABC2